MFKGSITALITPFLDGQVDEKAFQALVSRQVAEGSHGVVPIIVRSPSRGACVSAQAAEK